jgi:hypothetical protein
MSETAACATQAGFAMSPDSAKSYPSELTCLRRRRTIRQTKLAPHGRGHPIDDIGDE